ncbi:MAG: hypothetical protein ACETWE_09210 [Candidatus Bathyarchaeia archaeon]
MVFRIFDFFYVDLYERNVKVSETPEEAELVEAPSVPEVFERMLESKL